MSKASKEADPRKQWDRKTQSKVWLWKYTVTPNLVMFLNEFSQKYQGKTALIHETYSILKSFPWQLMFESHVPSNCFIHFPCWPKIKHKMVFYFYTNLQQIYSPSSNYSSRSIFQTSGEEEKERYTHLSAEFQRITRRPSSAIDAKK